MRVIRLLRDLRYLRLRHLAYGAATYLPGVPRDLCTHGRRPWARRCSTPPERHLDVWLQHLAVAVQYGLSDCPGVVCEMGPGASLGVGLAALLSGVDEYFALDVVAHLDTQKSVVLLEQLVRVFHERMQAEGGSITGRRGDAHVELDAKRLRISLDSDRVARIRRSILNHMDSDSLIHYLVPWDEGSLVGAGSVDLVLSQAVMEHVDEPRHLYETTQLWLKPGRVCTHLIDLRSHNSTRLWNGHWAISDATWRIARGRQPYQLNRLPCSEHMALMRVAGFDVVGVYREECESELDPAHLIPRLRGMSDADLRTSKVLVVGRK